MFEKEADKAETKMIVESNGIYSKFKNYKDGFKDGAEFGYNKAREDADKMKSQFLELCNLKNMRIEELEKANEWHEMNYNDKESYKNIPRCVELLTEYNCGLFVAHCVNKWTGSHWCEHSYAVTAWKEIVSS